MSEAQATPLGWRRRLGLLLVLLLVVSVGARIWLDRKEQEQPSSSTTPGLTALTGDQATGEGTEPEKTGWQKILPFVSEGAFAMILGLALGIATRMIFKIVVFGIVVFFLATQFLAYKGVIDVDWGKFWHWTKDFVLNVSAQADLGSIVKHKLPAVGAFIIGYLLGLKRG